jgi:antitoxin CptB
MGTMGDLLRNDVQLENPDARYRRLMFRCWHRGTQESDLILGMFADGFLKSLDDAQLDRFEALLDCTDPDLFDWMFGVSAPPPEHDHDVMSLLRGFIAAPYHRPRQSGQH